MSIVRVGLAETKNFADGYEAIFGKKKEEPDTAKAKAKAPAKKSGAKKAAKPAKAKKAEPAARTKAAGKKTTRKK